ncbi:MAG TPA: hypothetical protein VFP32_01170 [Candidatus Saccharimonadales bacterium]|nr:hypothetical protein [Candidatus Saccharimonadales bacterium]
MSGKRVLWLVVGIAWMVAILLTALPTTHKAYAQQITTRSLTLEAGTTDGGSAPGGVVNHLFTFTVPNVGGGNIGSIKFQYCMAAREQTCTSATTQGLVSTSATLGAQTDAKFTAINNTTNGAPYVSNPAPQAFAAGATIKVELNSITNITPANTSFYVDITTYTSSDATGSPVDEGWVAASTANAIVLTGTMPESLVFCAGGSVSETSGVPDCSTATAGNISFNQLFSPTDTAYATSQMSASTNAQYGYNITVNGSTLMSGSNPVTAMSTPGTSQIGKSQFGLNVVHDTATDSLSPALSPLSASVTPTGASYFGEPSTNYGTDGTYAFNTGDTVADSALGGVAKGTDSQIYTVTYLVNANGAQPAGTYTTTLTYICTATY